MRAETARAPVDPTDTPESAMWQELSSTADAMQSSSAERRPGLSGRPAPNGAMPVVVSSECVHRHIRSGYFGAGNSVEEAGVDGGESDLAAFSGVEFRATKEPEAV